jgi:hypothetical protein
VLLFCAPASGNAGWRRRTADPLHLHLPRVVAGDVALAQDRDGFVWMGAGWAESLDGYSFRIYKHDRDDASTLTHDYI